MRYLIIPDVHGRDFWREPVATALKDENTHIIFLGDYLDPYPDEFEKGVDYQEVAVLVFKDILKLKEESPDKITLLLGNHDLEYAAGTEICNCRRDRKRYDVLQKQFREKKGYFSLLKEVKQGDKRFIISHAGLSLEWAKKANIGDFTKDNVVDYLNNAYLLMMDDIEPDATPFGIALGYCSYYRGGYDRVSSVVWADVREFVFNDVEDIGYQIFGHTRSYAPIICEKFAMLDCSKAFYLNEDGSITESDGTVPKTFTFDELRGN